MTESSTMGMIIPPSTPMIVYSMISGVSVGALFVAGAADGGCLLHVPEHARVGHCADL